MFLMLFKHFLPQKSMKIISSKYFSFLTLDNLNITYHFDSVSMSSNGFNILNALGKFSLEYYSVFSIQFFIMPRHQKSGRVLCYTLWNFECPSVCPSVCPSAPPPPPPQPHPLPPSSSARNSSYSFRPILFKLYRRFQDGLKICILFLQNPEIIFYHIFCIFNLDFFRALILQKCIGSMYLVHATPPTFSDRSF